MSATRAMIQINSSCLRGVTSVSQQLTMLRRIGNRPAAIGPSSVVTLLHAVTVGLFGTWMVAPALPSTANLRTRPGDTPADRGRRSRSPRSALVSSSGEIVRLGAKHAFSGSVYSRPSGSDASSRQRIADFKVSRLPCVAGDKMRAKPGLSTRQLLPPSAAGQTRYIAFLAHPLFWPEAAVNRKRAYFAFVSSAKFSVLDRSSRTVSATVPISAAEALPSESFDSCQIGKNCNAYEANPSRMPAARRKADEQGR
jgi:hypothetical protein